MMTKMTYDTSAYTFFYNGPFSQWHRCSFRLNDFWFNTAEQYMMYSKAILFDDDEIAQKILKSDTAREQKSLGKEVKNFDDEIWIKHAPTIVYAGNYGKFTQNETLLNLLLETKGTTLVEAAPYDRRWGIGLSEKDALVTDPSNWPGKNWLGKVLTRLRKDLSGE